MYLYLATIKCLLHIGSVILEGYRPIPYSKKPNGTLSYITITGILHVTHVGLDDNENSMDRD